MDDQLLPWLRTQIAEAERVARAAPPGPWTVKTWPDDETVEIRTPDGERAAHNGDGYHRWPDGSAEHIALHDPASVLAQCEAHTRILDQFDERFSDLVIWEPILLALALAYRHCPGYREEEDWAW